jgi:hypothetical protein
MKKTKTSSEVKYRYNKKTYDNIRFAVRKELGAAFREKIAKRKETIAGVLRAAVIAYIEKKDEDKNGKSD